MGKIYENCVTKYKITSKFGYRTHPITGKKAHHDGIDIISNENSKNIYALEDGYVYKIKTGQDNATTGYGNYIWVRYPRIDISIFYAHCKSIKLKKGDKVEKGKVIAIMGKTGAATGIHLHLGMTKIGSDTWINPETYNYQMENKVKNKKGVERNKEKNQLKVLVENLRIRKSPSTKSEIVAMSIKNNIYDYFDVMKDNLYTWYRISDDEWIANNGQYLEIYEKEQNEEEGDKISQSKNESGSQQISDNEFKEKIEVIEQLKLNTQQEQEITDIMTDYKFKYKVEKTAIYKIKLNKGEQLIIK